MNHGDITNLDADRAQSANIHAAAADLAADGRSDEVREDYRPVGQLLRDLGSIALYTFALLGVLAAYSFVSR